MNWALITCSHLPGRQKAGKGLLERGNSIGTSREMGITVGIFREL